MNDFLFEVQKQMIMLKKKNLNILNEFKIQMFQARKAIQKRLINQEFDIRQSNLMQTQKFKNNFNQNNSTFNQDTMQSQTTQRYPNNIQNLSSKHYYYLPSSNNTTVTKNLSTNYHSRNNQSKSNININPFGKLSDLKIKNHYNHYNLDPQNKQNINPNAKILKTDISVIQEFPLKYSKVQYNQRHTTESDQPFQKQMKDLKVEQSILMPTQNVKNKYLKFRSPLSDNLFSAQSQIRSIANHDHVMPCSEFHHENTQFDGMNQNENYQNENSINQQEFYQFGFTTIQQSRKKPSLIQEKPQLEQNESLKNF